MKGYFGMQINGAESKKVINHAMKKSEKILDKAKNIVSDKKIDLALTSAAVSGAYIAHKTYVKNHDITSETEKVNYLSEKYQTNFSEVLSTFKNDNEENYNIISNNLDNITNFKNGRIRTSLGSVKWKEIHLSDGNIFAIMTDDSGKITDSKHLKINPEKEECKFNAVFKGMVFALEETIVQKTEETNIVKETPKPEPKIISDTPKHEENIIGKTINRLGEPINQVNQSHLDMLKAYGYDDETAKILLSKDTGNSFGDFLESFYFIKKFCPNIIAEIKKNPDELKITTGFGQLELKVNGQNVKTFREGGTTHTVLNNEFEYFEQKKRIYGSDKFTYITTTKNLKDNTQKTIEQKDSISDMLGVVHKSKREKEKNEKFYKNTITESDGTIRQMVIEFDELKRYKNKNIVHYSKDGVINAKTEIQYDYSNPDKIITTVKDVDYKNNRSETSILKLKDNIDLYDYNNTYSDSTVVKRIRTFTNPVTGEVMTEISKKSDIDKVMNTVIVDSKGNKTITSLGKISKDGTKFIEKHLTSLDGCITDYKLKDSPVNGTEMLYQIKDKDGKVLSTTTRKFKHITPDKTYTNLNGQEWITNFKDDKIIIQNLQTGKEIHTNFSDLIREDSISKDKLKQDIKNMPADMIEFITKKYIPIQTAKESAYCDFYINLNNLNDFPHELGHAKDDRFGKIFQNHEFREIYEKEKAEYIKAFSGIEKTKIEYLISEADRKSVV